MGDALIKGISLGLLLSILVGPVLFSIIKHSLNNGMRGGLAFVIGVSLSEVSLVIAANFFTEVFRDLSSIRSEIGIVGSTFMITVGIYFLFFKKIKVNEAGAQIIQFRKRDYVKMAIAGYFMNILNPGIILFWLTITTAFIGYSLEHRLLTFGIAVAFLFAADVAKVFLAGKLRKRLTVRNIALLNRINGIILIGFGLVLLVSLLFYSHKLPQ